MPRPRIVPALLVVTLALLGGCGKQLTLAPHENARPTVSFSRAPSRAGDLYDYTYEMRWTGFDPDGEVASFRYAIDPPAPTTAVPDPDTAWVATTEFGGTFEFHAGEPQPPVPNTNRLAADYHTFVIEAIDNRGLISLPATVAFNASTVVPVARILSPVPSSRFRQYLPPSFTITWDGTDLDGVASKKPIFYRTKIISGSTPITPTLLAAYPDTLLNYYLPRGWATWDSLGPSVNSVTLSQLPPLQDFVFVVIAFDEAGAYTPYVSGDVNALNFRALYATVGGPALTVFNEFFTYTYDSGTYTPNDPKSWINLEVPARTPLTFNWSAKAQQGTIIRSYRWTLDSQDLSDDTPRSDEQTDMAHWSFPTSTTISAKLPAFNTAGDHRLYIEATDGNDLKSLAVVHFTVVPGTLDKPLAIADDTRFKVDERSVGAATCINQPKNRFPTAAELDTFLYARGGVPMKCYPAGSVSRPGLFRGYDYDTLNMRTGRLDQTPSLSMLGRYRHILWLVNTQAALLSNDGTDIISGKTALYYMNQSGHLNALTAYLKMGGELWLAGGGAVLTSLSGAKVITPGRFVYDYGHWRSDLKTTSGVFQVRRTLGRLTGTGAYSTFPDVIPLKSLAAGDSMPPWRTITGDFYLSTFDVEALVTPDRVVEDFDPSDDGEDLRSALDTLYAASGGILPANSPAMTVYNGTENSRVILTGFDLWTFNRATLIRLIDGVLQGIWGLSRNGPPPMPAASRRVRADAIRTGTNVSPVAARPPAPDSR